MLVVMKQYSWLRWTMAMVIAAMLFTLVYTVTQADETDPILFYDTFEDGVEAEDNEFFGWRSHRKDSTGDFEISSDIARTGDYSMKFTFHGVPSGEDNWVEKRFDLPTERDELWLRWYQYFPDGTEGLGAKWNHRSDSPNNNKFLAIGNKDWYYPSSFGLYYVNTHRVGNGDSMARIYYRPDGGAAGTYSKSPLDNLGMVHDESMRGRWVEFIVHAKLSSAYQEADGIFEMWVDGNQIYYEDKLNTWPYSPGEQDPLALEQYNIFNHGYLMGWANSGFTETSHTYIDDFSLLDGPPKSLNYTGGPPESFIRVDECSYPEENWIFCDDFEDEESLDLYYDFYRTWGRFQRHTNGIDGSRALSSYFGYYSADPTKEPYKTWLKLAFGKTPNDTLYRPVGDPEVAEREVNFRFYVRSTSDRNGDNSTGPLANVLAFGPPVDSERIPFMKVEVSYPDQSGTLQSKLYGGVFDESGEPIGNELLETLIGTKPVMLPIISAEWHEIEIYVKLNDPGEANGVYELRIDGEVESSSTGINWVGDYTDYGINSIEIENMNNQIGMPGADSVNRTFDNLLLTRGSYVEEPGDPGDGEPGGPGDPGDPYEPPVVVDDVIPIAGVDASVGTKEEMESTFDGDLSTRWNVWTDIGSEWIAYDLGASYDVDGVAIARNNGHERRYFFDIEVSTDGNNWTEVYSGESSGTTDQLELYSFDEIEARYVRVVGSGNTWNEWTNISEIEIYGSGPSGEGPGDPGEPPVVVDGVIPIVDVDASEGTQTERENTYDGDMTTYWSVNTGSTGSHWIKYDLGASYELNGAAIAWYYGHQRGFHFDIEVSSDGDNWTEVYNGTSSGTTEQLELYPFTEIEAQYVRITGYGNTVNAFTNIFEVEIYGSGPIGEGPGEPDPEVSGASLSGDDTLHAGDAVELNIGIVEAASSFTTMEVLVKYDPDKLEFETDTTGTVLTESAITSLKANFNVLGTAIKPDQGEILVIISSTGEQHPIGESGDLFRLYGNVKDDATTGNTTVSLLDFKVSLNGTVTTVDVSEAAHVINILEVDETEVDFTALIDMIGQAQARYDRAVEGNKIGQYSAEARADLYDAIEAATLLLDDNQITQQGINEAVDVLEAAVVTFIAQFISLVEGATSITIADLSIMSSYFGTASNDPEWSEIEIADLLDKEVIDQDNLSAAAQLILDEWLQE